MQILVLMIKYVRNLGILRAMSKSDTSYESTPLVISTYSIRRTVS